MRVPTLASLLGSAALVLPIIFARAAKVENVFEIDTAYAGFSEVLVRANGNLLASHENDNHIWQIYPDSKTAGKFTGGGIYRGPGR